MIRVCELQCTCLLLHAFLEVQRPENSITWGGAWSGSRKESPVYQMASEPLEFSTFRGTYHEVRVTLLHTLSASAEIDAHVEPLTSLWSRTSTHLSWDGGYRCGLRVTGTCDQGSWIRLPPSAFNHSGPETLRSPPLNLCSHQRDPLETLALW